MGQEKISAPLAWMTASNFPGMKWLTYTEEKEGNWFGYILRRNCLLKHITEGN